MLSALAASPLRDMDIEHLEVVDHTTRKVVVLLASAESNAQLRAWAEAAGFDLAADYDGNPRDPARFDFHVTLLATADPAGIPETEHAIAPLTVYAEGFKVLGVDRRVPCLAIDVEADDFDVVRAMREHYLATYGAEPTFADFVPHVSLSYAWDGTPSLAELEPPDMPIVLDRIRVKPLADKPKSAAPSARKSAAPQMPAVDLGQFTAAAQALMAAYAAWGAIATRYSDIVDEYYRTGDASRVHEIIAECRQIQQQAAPFAAANQALVDAVRDAGTAVRDAIDTAVDEIADFYDLDYESEFMSPEGVIVDVDDQIEDMHNWLADDSAEAAPGQADADEPKSRKARGLARKSRIARKSFLDGFDAGIEAALADADGGPELLAAYRAVAAEIDAADAEIVRLTEAMRNVAALAEQLLGVRELSGETPSPADRAEAFARHDELMTERDGFIAEKESLLTQASRIEAEMLRLVS